MTYLIVYADDREIDAAKLRSPSLVLLKTGVGKVRAATAVTNWLNSALTANRPKPRIVSVGTCAGTSPDLVGKLVRPHRAIDRDSTPSLLRSAGVDPMPIIRLNGVSDSTLPDAPLTIGTGDSFVANTEYAQMLASRGVQLVDMETHAVAWAATQCYAGPIYSIRYVSDDASGTAATDWKDKLSEARVTLTQAVLRLTEATSDA